MDAKISELEKAEKEFDLALESYELATSRKARKAARIEYLYARAKYLESLKNHTDFFQNWR